MKRWSLDGAEDSCSVMGWIVLVSVVPGLSILLKMHSC